MQILLDKPEFERFVEEQVRSGRFKSPQEVIQGALTLLKAHEALSPDELASLRSEIAIGVAEADRGDVEPWDPDEIEAEVERRHAGENKRG